MTEEWMMSKEELSNIVHPSWVKILHDLFIDERMKGLLQFLGNEQLNNKIVFPKKEDVFKAFKLCPYDELRVIFIGQDCYHQINQATGLCFAVPSNTHYRVLPPSLKNILRELIDNYDLSESQEENFWKYFNYDLTHWATQGCLMLNTALTVRKGEPTSHSKQWLWFTTEVINRLQEYRTGLIFVQWGNHAKQFSINKNNYVLQAGHPSPLNTSVPFKGNKHFLKINEIIESTNGKDSMINWFN